MTKSISVLLVEDDQYLADLVAIQLRTNMDAQVDIINNGWQALDQAHKKSYDIIILDLMLPGINGLEICRKIRQVNKVVPVLMLTAKSEEQDKIDGFNIGADDYLSKPFFNSELIARLKALLRRTHPEIKSKDSQTMIQHHELRLDLENHTLYKLGEVIELTAKEFELIHFFLKNPGRALTRLQLLNEVWGPHFDGLEHTVNSTINRLRSKIEKDLTKPEYILTAWGIGYRFCNI